MNQDIIIFTYVICLIGAIFFLFKYPAANWFLSWTLLVGDSASSNLGLIYSRFIYIVLFLSIGSLLFQGDVKHNLQKIIVKFKEGRFKLFSIIIIIIVAKIFFEFIYYGFDLQSTIYLKKSIYFVVFPILITLFSLIKNPIPNALRHFIIGFCFYSTIISFVTIISGLGTTQFLLGDQLTFSSMDAINGGRFLFFAAISYLIASLISIKRNYRLFFSLMSLTFFMFVLFNGQRQFVISYIIGILLLFFLLKEFKKLRVLFFGFMLAGTLIFTNIRILMDTAFISKFNNDHIKMEMESNSNRMQIWKVSYDLAATNPLLGIGFGNFRENSFVNKTLSKKIVTPHGFFAEIMVEHGLILLSLALFSFIYISFMVFRKSTFNQQRSQVIFLYSFFLLSFPENFYQMGRYQPKEVSAIPNLGARKEAPHRYRSYDTRCDYEYRSFRYRSSPRPVYPP